jgi:tRNA A-37 threonylcarbamoyl transferase component Bud32
MIRLQINPAFVDLLQSRNLHGYHQVMQTSLGEVIEENNLRDIRCLDLDGVKLYLKRTRSEKASSAFESYCRGRLPHSRPYKEMMLLRLLKQLGFDVAEVVAVGEELRFGVPLRGFIITLEVPGQDLSQVYREADKADRNSIMIDFGSLLGRLHRKGFFGSTRLKDIISTGKPGDPLKLTLIDRETRNPYRKQATRDKVIARLLFNIRRQARQGEIFTAGEWESFTDSYCQSLNGDFGIDAKDLLTEILAVLDRPGKEYLAK